MVDVNSIENTISGAQSMSVGSINWAMIIFWITIFLAFIIVLIITYIVIKVLQYNITAIVEERHEHGIFIKVKRARIVYDKKSMEKNPVEMIRILGDRVSKPIMPPTHVIEQLKREGKETLIKSWHKSLYGTTNRGRKAIRLVKDGDVLTVIPFTNVEVTEYLRITKPVRSQWANNLFLEGMQMYKDEPTFMQKYGVMLGLAGLMMTIIIVFALLFNQFDVLKDNASAINTFAGALNNHATALKQSCSQALS